MALTTAIKSALQKTSTAYGFWLTYASSKMAVYYEANGIPDSPAPASQRQSSALQRNTQTDSAGSWSMPSTV